MARDSNSNRPTAGVWFARIRTGTARRVTRQRGEGIDPLLRQRLEEAADAAAEAADRAARAARAADQAVGLSELMEAFGPRQGASPEQVVEAADRSIEAAVEALDGGARAASQGQLAKIAAQEEAAETEPRLQRHAGLGELWHR